MHTDLLTQSIIGHAIEVHKILGPGLLESTYESCLMYELNKHDITASRQVILPLTYKGLKIDTGYRIDILLPEKLIIELKAIDKILPVHVAQTLTYMKLSHINTGLIINFNVKKLIHGLKRLRL
ncbi:GxxExxY protein [Paraglaciecola aquimarina]|uniref:GxxExxY protein n=1 Tax=Paraglaciecola algarum TaxID=3050085 RepID=A0ABS9DD09_9ALTE|nr:GxxExxY protein [Paraglaciecola sp. G1-23]MCF2949882.1 GxxExxY protein [Paraglaciecola sp. G1-23]